MPQKDTPPLSDVIAGFYKQLSSSAKQLNAASDDLGRQIAEVDNTFQKLNLGIETWVEASRWSDLHDVYHTCDLGYAKDGKRWGLSIREVTGHAAWPEDDSVQWFFNEAPRALRATAVDAIPELLAALVKQADATTEKIKAKTEQTREVVTALSQAATDEMEQRRRLRESAKSPGRSLGDRVNEA